MQYLITAFIAVSLTIASAFGVYNYVPMDALDITSHGTFGSTITTIQGSDTLSSSRSVINTNFANLNADKLEISAFAATTSQKNLAELGTITTGTWHATTIGVPYGGTGSTTLSQYQVLLGNGTGNVSLVSGFGSSGQFLTSNGNGVAPTWQTSSINQNDNYTWTGLHIFQTLGAIFQASTTFSNIANFTATTTVATTTNAIGFSSKNWLVAGMPITATTPQAVTISTSTGLVYLVDGDNSTTTDFQGYALTSTTGSGQQILVQTTGIVTGFSGLTAGLRYYVQDTSTGGAIGTSVGTSEVYAGIAIAPTQILLDSQGSAHGMQYLGSQSLTCAASADTAINQPLARFALITSTANTASAGSSGPTINLSKIGLTVSSWKDVQNIGVNLIAGVQFTWTSTTSIRSQYTDDSTSCSATAYYYR